MPHARQCAVSFLLTLCYNYIANILTLYCQFVCNMVFFYLPYPKGHGEILLIFSLGPHQTD